ncbi:hypothetical protein FRC02_003698, partial [Tulasnella sp. 418]
MENIPTSLQESPNSLPSSVVLCVPQQPESASPVSTPMEEVTKLLSVGIIEMLLVL